MAWAPPGRALVDGNDVERPCFRVLPRGGAMAAWFIAAILSDQELSALSNAARVLGLAMRLAMHDPEEQARMR